MAENTIKWDSDADGIVTLTLDDPTAPRYLITEAGVGYRLREPA